MTESEFRDWVRGWLSALDGRVKGFEGRPAGAAYPHPAFMEGLALLKERIEALEAAVGGMVRERAEQRARLGRLHEARRKAKARPAPQVPRHGVEPP